MSPIPPLAHLLAIAAGVFGGLWLGGCVSPTCPTPGPTRASPSARASRADDPDSLFHAGPLAEAVAQTVEQFPAGEEVSNVQIEPGNLRAAPAEGVEPPAARRPAGRRAGADDRRHHDAARSERATKPVDARRRQVLQLEPGEPDHERVVGAPRHHYRRAADAVLRESRRQSRAGRVSA